MKKNIPEKVKEPEPTDRYDVNMDPGTLRLCNAINKFKGIATYSSCCGHEKDIFSIEFCITGNCSIDLPALLFFFDGCHSGVYDWTVQAYTDCAAENAGFAINSKSKGKKAYEEADKIAGIMEKAGFCPYECNEVGIGPL